jgi:large subunit ribosomal protein L4
MKLTVVDIQGKETSKSVSLDPKIFGVEPNDHAIYLDVKQFLANQRQGTHKTKQKWEINKSTKKIKKQKGTGTARAGSAKSGTMVGGARMFGPQPRNYSFKLNKKLKDVARLSALTYKAKTNSITVIENFTFDKPSTKSFVNVLLSLNLNSVRTLIVTPTIDKQLLLSSRNYPNTKILPASDINTYEILKAKNLVVFEESFKVIEQHYNK